MNSSEMLNKQTPDRHKKQKFQEVQSNVPDKHEGLVNEDTEEVLKDRVNNDAECYTKEKESERQRKIQELREQLGVARKEYLGGTELNEAEIKFAEVYKSPEWLSLEPLDRAQLLLVAEGVKSGTIIGADFSNFEKIIKRMGLEASLNTDPRLLNPIYNIAYPEQMKKYYEEILLLPENASNWEFHRITGRFLGYPECCIEEYIRAGKEVEQKENEGVREDFISNVDKEANEMINRESIYPAELDYCPPSFTPCSAKCPEALKILGQWGKLLEKIDTQAAQELKEFNQNSEPYNRIHKLELEMKAKAETEREKITALRESIGNDK